MSTQNNIENILRSNMAKVEELTKRSETRKFEFIFKDGVIQYGDYVGKGGMLLKSAIAYVKVFLDDKNCGVNYLKHTTIQTFGKDKKGNIKSYPTDAWQITDKKHTPQEVIELFQDVVDMGRKIYKESKENK